MEKTSRLKYIIKPREGKKERDNAAEPFFFDKRHGENAEKYCFALYERVVLLLSLHVASTAINDKWFNSPPERSAWLRYAEINGPPMTIWSTFSLVSLIDSWLWTFGDFRCFHAISPTAFNPKHTRTCHKTSRNVANDLASFSLNEIWTFASDETFFFFRRNNHDMNDTSFGISFLFCYFTHFPKKCHHLVKQL